MNFTEIVMSMFGIMFFIHEFTLLKYSLNGEVENILTIIKASHDLSGLTKSQKSFISKQTYYMIWTFVGFLTSEWKLFLALLVLSIISSIINTLQERPKFMAYADFVISQILILTIIVRFVTFQ